MMVQTSIPFISGDTIRFTFPSGALTDGQTYWWRVRSRRSDTLALSAWSTPRTFTVDTAQTDVSQWHQTTSQQFVNDTLADAVTGRESPTLRVIDSGATTPTAPTSSTQWTSTATATPTW